MFVSSGPSNGLLDGEKARDIFIKSNLPFAQLGAIWTLADTKSRGALDATDFIVGMHLIQLAMSKSLPSSELPSTLPAGLYESALVPVANTARPTSPPAVPIPRQTTGILKPQSTGDGNAMRPVARQNTGQSVHFSPPAPSSPVRPFRSASVAFAQPQTPLPWDITPAEKARFDGFFDSIDTSRQGYVEGEQAVAFFLESRLPETVLAQIWQVTCNYTL